MARKRSQQEERKHMVFRDQHGRTWDASFDVMGMASAGPKTPRGWYAPLIPPEAYIREDNTKPGMFDIQYDSWINDLKERRAQHESDKHLWANNLGKPVDSPDVMRQVGKGPYPVEMVQAARQGNRWVLGQSEKVPQWAQAFKDWWGVSTITHPIEDTENQFPDAEPDFSDQVFEFEDDKYGAYEDDHDPNASGSQSARRTKVRKGTPQPPRHLEQVVQSQGGGDGR